jgi:hypothetical protein
MIELFRTRISNPPLVIVARRLFLLAVRSIKNKTNWSESGPLSFPVELLFSHCKIILPGFPES